MDFHYFHVFLCLCEEMMAIFKAKTTIAFFEKRKYTPGNARLFGGIHDSCVFSMKFLRGLELF